MQKRAMVVSAGILILALVAGCAPSTPIAVKPSPTPTKTPRPTFTVTPAYTPTPTNTSTPVFTPTPVPTDTLVPTDTPVVTDTPVPPPATNTPVPPPPTNTPVPQPPTATPTDTPVPPPPTPAFPFHLVEQIVDPTSNTSIYAEGKIYEGETPLAGYRLKLVNLNSGRSYDGEESVSAPGWNCEPRICGGLAKMINCKVTSSESWGDASWEIYVIDGSGAQVSEKVQFQTNSANPQLFYFHFGK